MSQKIASLEDLHQHKMEAKHQLQMERLKFENSKLQLKQGFSLEQIKQDVFHSAITYVQNKFINKFSNQFSRFFDKGK